MWMSGLRVRWWTLVSMRITCATLLAHAENRGLLCGKGVVAPVLPQPLWTPTHCDTCGNLQFHIFLLASLIPKDLRERDFILSQAVSFMKAFIFRYF